MLKRRVDKLLSFGNGRQLLWLLALSVVFIAIYVAIAKFIIKDEFLTWQYIVGLFLDPGVYGSFSDRGHDIFRISIALLSVFLFSALLVSVFTNVFENISDSVRKGKRRYKFKGHVLILGSGHQVEGILSALKKDDRPVVVMSENKPEFDGRYVYYYGNRDNYDDLESARVEFADTIYVIGEDDEIGHDARNLHCLDMLGELSRTAEDYIHCFLVMHDEISIEVFQFLKRQEGSKLLLVDVIDDNEYKAEQLLVNTDFLPVIRKDDDYVSHIYIIGKSDIAKAVAYTAAHISHYPNFTEGKNKSIISFVGSQMEEWMETFIAAHRGLFELSEYSFVTKEQEINHHVSSGKSDFLDIKWEFIDAQESSSLFESRINSSIAGGREMVTICICHENERTAIESVLHLPDIVYGRELGNPGVRAYNIAVYLRQSSYIIDRANSTDMYNITIFGNNCSAVADPLFERRSQYGKRVNFIYDKAYGNPPSKDEEEAWYKLPEAHKYSSIYCANAMFLRDKCFDQEEDRTAVYEAEHRRWMMALLLMGYKSGSVTDRRHFVHSDIIPYSKLPLQEQEKDKILIDSTPYILGKGALV